MKTRAELDRDYDSAREDFRVVSREYTKAQKEYRARQIGDTAFLKARKALDAANVLFDKLESEYIEAVNDLEGKSSFRKASSARFKKRAEPLFEMLRKVGEVKS